MSEDEVVDFAQRSDPTLPTLYGGVISLDQVPKTTVSKLPPSQTRGRARGLTTFYVQNHKPCRRVLLTHIKISVSSTKRLNSAHGLSK